MTDLQTTIACAPRHKLKAWKILVYAALFLNITEGAMRKWFFPGSSQLIYFAKDGLLIAAYAFFFLSGSSKGGERIKTLTTLFLLAAVVICIDAFNSNLGSPILGVFGIKCYLLYVGLIYLGAQLFENWNDFQRFIRWQVIVAIPICLLGIQQFRSPADAEINRYAAGDEQIISTFGADATVRITGTFAYITGHVSFLFATVALAVGLLGTSSRRSDRLLSVATLVLCAGNVLMSGSRAPGIYIAILVSAVLAWFGFQRNRVALRIRILLVVAIALAAFTTTTLFNQAYNAYLDRIETADDEFLDRAFQHHDVFGQILDYVGFTGYGTGITHPGSAALQQALRLEPSEPVPMFEAEYARVLVELGWIGGFLWYLLRLGVLYAIWKVYRKLRSTELQCWAFVILIVHLLSLNASVVLNHTYAIYYWLLAGVALGLPHLESGYLEAKPARTQETIWRLQPPPALPAENPAWR
jgi:hypothetical protein